MYKLTFKGINTKGQALFLCFTANDIFDVIREGIDTYYRFDVSKGHGIGDALRNVSFS